MKIPDNISELIEKYQSGTASSEELRQLNEWYRSFDDSEVEIAAESSNERQIAERIKLRLLETIQEGRQTKKIKKMAHTSCGCYSYSNLHRDLFFPSVKTCQKGNRQDSSTPCIRQ